MASAIKHKHRYQHNHYISIQERDIAILKKVNELRFLESRHIEKLWAADKWYIRKRLKKLTDYGFLTRPRDQYYFHRTRRHFVYALGNKGADLIYEDQPDKRRQIDWTEKNREVQYRFIDHALAVADFLVALELALKNHPTMRLVQWQRESDKFTDYVTLPNQKQKVRLRPDVFFAVESISRGTVHNFFLEADRGRADNKTFAAKMHAYYKWGSSRQHEKKGIKGFQVLTVTTGRKRAENLRANTADIIKDANKNSAFLFAAATDFSFYDPPTVLTAIWQEAGDSNQQFPFYHRLEVNYS